MGVIAVYSIFGFQYLTMMPVVARDVLHTGASGYGLLLTFVGIGALTGALSLAGAGRADPPRPAVQRDRLRVRRTRDSFLADAHRSTSPRWCCSSWAS